MIALEDALPLGNVALYVDAESVTSAVDRALRILENDARVTDWSAFVSAVKQREKQSSTQLGGGLLLPHGRGDFVSELSMSLIRLQTPIPGDAGDLHFVIAMAIPASMISDYLRLVGALVRAFRDEKTRDRLNSFNTSTEIVNWLGARCR